MIRFAGKKITERRGGGRETKEGKVEKKRIIENETKSNSGIQKMKEIIVPLFFFFLNLRNEICFVVFLVFAVNI